MRRSVIISGLLFCCFFSLQARVFSGEYTVTRLTDNDYTDWEARIHDGQIVWEGQAVREGSNIYDFEIFFYDGTQIKQFTDNDYPDRQPRIYSGQIAWQQGSRIMFYDGSRTIQIGTGSSPEIHNGKVTWFSWDGHDYEIFLYDGVQTIKLTDNDYNDQYPKIYNGRVTWLGYDGHDYEIFFYDGTNIAQLTNDEYSCWKPQIYDGQVVWQGYNGGNHEIYHYDGDTVKQLTDTRCRQQNPQINNGQIAWEGYDGDGPDAEIYFYDGSKIIRVTDNDYPDHKPQLDNGRIVWESWDVNNWEIYLYNNGKVFPVTDNADNDREPYISKDLVVWFGESYGIDKGSDWEIFSAKIKSDSVKLLDGSEFSAGSEISDDPEKIVSQEGTLMQGVVADGVTRLLLKADVSGPCRMTVSIDNPGNEREDSILRSIDGSYQGSSITVNSVSTSQGEKAFAIYQAPENFVRLSHEDEDRKASERKIKFKVKIDKYDNSPVSDYLIECRILRPPVVLVHGLWADPSAWSDFAGSLELNLPGINIVVADYQKNNDRSFDVNKYVVSKYILDTDSNIESAKSKLRAEQIAMIQADIIGHSMGGLLARIYAGSKDVDFYKRNDNFQSGDIHKLITLHSPHLGSFLADIAINEILNGPYKVGRLSLINSFRFAGKSIDRGAVEDLMTTSYAIEDMNTKMVDVPTHAFAGDYIVARGDLNNIETEELKWVHLTLKDYNTLPYIACDKSDLIVSFLSQTGDLPISGSTFEDCDHLNVLSDAKGADIIPKVIDLLNTSVDDMSFRIRFPVKK